MLFFKYLALRNFLAGAQKKFFISFGVESIFRWHSMTRIGLANSTFFMNNTQFKFMYRKLFLIGLLNPSLQLIISVLAIIFHGPCQYNIYKTCVPSMIHSARPTVLPVAITILAWKLFCFARFWKVGTDGRTDNTCENCDHHRPWLWVGLVDQKRFLMTIFCSIYYNLRCFVLIRYETGMRNTEFIMHMHLLTGLAL